MARSNLDVTQIYREVFNPEEKALDVKVKDLSVGFSLNHEEDSIETHSKVVTGILHADEEADLSGTKQITVYGEPGTILLASPVSEGNLWYGLGVLPDLGVLTLNVCVLRLSADKDIHIVAV